MKNIKATFALVILLSGISFSQEVVGKIYSKQEADSLYGPVVSSVGISSSILIELLSNSTNYIMFRMANESVYIVDNNRHPLFSGNFAVDSVDVYRVLSISMVAKIVQDGKNPVTDIEIRNKDILTITNGIYTLEYSVACPPWCF
jgi:hypothetical protein